MYKFGGGIPVQLEKNQTHHQQIYYTNLLSQ